MKRIGIFATMLFFCFCVNAQRSEILLEHGWHFAKGEIANASQINFDDTNWQIVDVPHDWAIYGPFDKKYDLQYVAVTQNGEIQATEKTGRTGGLPYMGVGWYRNNFSIPDFDATQQQISILFDGAMSEAQVFVNGEKVCFWPYGYNSFHCDITSFIHTDGKNNTLVVRLENMPQSSRWYPGAGLYRNVHLIVTNRVHVPIWGTCVTTPYVTAQSSSVRLLTTICNAVGKKIRISTEITESTTGKIVATRENTYLVKHELPIEQNFTIIDPHLWSPENPYLYKANSYIYANDTLTDEYTTFFGIRSLQLVPDKGFLLNGQIRKFQGVCNHHDLGPLGAAVNESALRHQLTLLKDMGCDAIRTSHNMPAPELVRLCDEMGFMMMIEPFDEWDVAKCKNGYHRFFADWAEKDMLNMLRHYRNHPSVVMWSIGNEVPTQCSSDGYKVAKFLQDICKREDPTRPVTCGMDQVSCVLENGFASILEVPGLNYRTNRYQEAYNNLPQNLVLGSETSSTVSSRGIYKFPAQPKYGALYNDHQSSGYDLEYCWWSNIPDEDFALAEDYNWTIGQFVWTGFDYLGEPTPYDTDAWSSHSSLFGIIDLAGIPKDRYYLYRSQWNKQSNTLHVLPHWTWPGQEGDTIPIFVYTNYPEAELFINGKSYGKRQKNKNSLMERYRLMWNDITYQPGEVKVVAYNTNGQIADTKIIRTAAAPHHLQLSSNRTELTANGKDLAYITVSIVDKDGNLCPHEGRLIKFKVSGSGKFRAVANGDPTNIELFHLPQMHAFSGQLTAIVQTVMQSGTLTLTASAKGLKTSTITITTK